MDTSGTNHADEIAEPQEYSSLPLVLTISSAILLFAAAGWFLPERDTAETIVEDDDVIALAVQSEKPPAVAAAIDVDSVLRKARLAADADVLAFPPEQSALYFYGRVVAADPKHPVANAEFDAVLTRVSQIATGHLAAGRFDDAYRLAVLVARQKPDHVLVEETRRSLNNHAARLVKQATQHVRDGNDGDAAAVLEVAEGLPGLNAEYFSAVRDSISEMQQSRIALERDRNEKASLAAEEATTEWTDRVRAAISSGRLVSPAGENARDYLAAVGSTEESKEELANELLAALVIAVQRDIDAGELVNAELYLNATKELGIDHDSIAELSNTLEDKLIEAEGNKIVGLDNFVPVKSEPVRYPRRANQQNITGWVEVLFTVTSTGVTKDIEVLRAEPKRIFDNSAISAIEKWTFLPREYRGQAIDQRTAARLIFDLEILE